MIYFLAKVNDGYKKTFSLFMIRHSTIAFSPSIETTTALQCSFIFTWACIFTIC